MVISHNMSALNAANQYTSTNYNIMNSMEKLSSGYRINRSADDAAGLTISEKMRYQIKGLTKAANGIQDGCSLLQVADGALNEVQSILQRMNELAVQAASDTNAAEDRTALQAEMNQLITEIDRIGTTTSFNSMNIFDKLHPDDVDEDISSLIKSVSGEKGYLAECYTSTAGNFYSAAMLDFGELKSSSISKLYDKSFSFHCSQACSEVFKFTFVNGGGNSVSGLTGRGTHQYNIDISGATTGTDVLDALYSYVNANPPTAYASSVGVDGSMMVSHSNSMLKIGTDVLCIIGNTAKVSKADAETYYASRYTSSTKSGAIDASEVIGTVVEASSNKFIIQTGFEAEDNLTVEIQKMNSQRMGINDIDVTSHSKASAAISLIQNKVQMISEQRSTYGAMQNRLEHARSIARNTSENVQNAESRIRDTDMAEEVTKLSKSNIIRDFTASVMSQINQNSNQVLSLLQA